MVSSHIMLSASDSAVASVTVFKSSNAEITRTLSLDLEQGNNKFEISGIPSSVDTESVRVFGLGSKARLFDVVCTSKGTKTAEIPDPKDPQEIVRILQAKKSVLQKKRLVLESSSSTLVSYSKTLGAEHVSPEAATDFLRSFLQIGNEYQDNIAAIDAEILDLDREAEVVLSRVTQPSGDAQAHITIVLGADVATEIELQISYIVSNVSWTPTYELHATTDKGKPCADVSLHYRAIVTQSTGEDWTNAKLTLSTMKSDTRAKALPTLHRVKIQQTPWGDSRGLFGSGGGFGGRPTQPVQGSTRPVAGQPVNVPPSFGFGAPQHGASLFGSATTTSSGLFGSAPVAQGSSLFGGASSASVNPTTSMFSAPAQTGQSNQEIPAAPASSTGSFGGLFGQPAFGSSTQADTAPEAGGDTSFSGDGAYETLIIPTPADLSAGGAMGQATMVKETPFALSLSIDGDSSIPSDGTGHQVPIAILPFESRVSYLLVPAQDPTLYLQCQVRNTSEYRLLPGSVTVLLDESFVSKTTISDINTGDKFYCTLGADSTVKISYVRKAKSVKTQAGAFGEGLNTTTYTAKTTINNTHPFSLENVIVRAVLPTAADPHLVKVLLRQPEKLIVAKEDEIVNLEGDLKVKWSKGWESGGEVTKDGKYEWHLSVDGNETREMEAVWEVQTPLNRSFSEVSTTD